MSTSDSGKEGESDPMIHDRDFWTDARDPYPATSSGGDAYVDGDKGRGAGGVEAFGLLEEGEDKDTWMEGVDVDPEAEAIFYGDKIPFPDLGKPWSRNCCFFSQNRILVLKYSRAVYPKYFHAT